MSENKYYFNDGMPTKPEVDQMLKKWPDINVGDKFSYKDVETLIQSQWNSARFKAVTNAWRRRMIDKGIVIECKAGEFFYSASADDVTSITHNVLKSVGKKSKKHRRKLLIVNTDTEEQKQTILHQSMLLHAIETDIKKSQTNLLPNTVSIQNAVAIPE
jgi:hypothetical protein